MTDIPAGYNAYRTYLAMVLHFKRGSYDGWSFNFNGKVSTETFEKNRLCIHRYAALEANHPSKNDQLRFYYPAFSKFNFVKATDVGVFTFQHIEFIKNLKELFASTYEKELVAIASQVETIDELLGLDGQVPYLYNRYIDKEISYESLVLLTLAIPSINTLCSKEPFLWKSLTDKLKFDSKFYMLYLTDETQTKQNLIQNTISILMNVWKLKR